MKNLLLLIVILLFVITSFAQPTKAEMDKMMKQAQEQMKKYSNDTAKVKAMKELLDQQKKITDAMENQSQNNNASVNGLTSADPSDYGNVDHWKFPAKNTVMLSSLPKKILTRTELVSFLNLVYTGLAKKLSPGVSSSVQSIAAKYKNDGNGMSEAAIVGWYTNYREESLLLIIKAAVANPDNGVLLNNCAAILNMSGIEQVAIPILKYILQSYPGDAMVLNNIGQGYAGLGETDTAMYYLGRCIKSEPKNVEANNTAGQIEAAKGNTGKAIEYFQQSLKGAYNKPAELKLRKIKKDSNIYPFAKSRYKIPEYFNQFKYALPAQCTKVSDAARVDAEYRAFQKIISTQLDVYMKKIVLLQNKFNQQYAQTGKITSPTLKNDDFAAQPFREFCGIMLRDMAKDDKDIHSMASGLDNKYYAAITALKKEYEDRLISMKKDLDKQKVSTETRCKALDALGNEYLPKYALLTEEWQEKNLLIIRKYFDDMIYWGYLSMHPVSNEGFLINLFYPLVAGYLNRLVVIGRSEIIEPCDFKPTTATSDSNEIKDIECPLDIEIPFIVGKFELNCEKFSFKAGEGVIFGYEKKFKAKQSTVSVGIGLKLELEAKVGPVKAGVSTNVGETFFITFDGNNNFSDGGLKFDAKASAGVEGAAGGPIKVKKDFAKSETGVGYTLGINSGWNFSEGPFKEMFGPAPEVQLNKNVKMDKSNRP